MYELTSSSSSGTSFKGVLNPGIYYVVEKSAPSGYLSSNKAYQFNVGYYDEDGDSTTDTDYNSSNIKFMPTNGDDDTSDSSYKNYTVVTGKSSTSNGVVTVKVENSKSKGISFSKKGLLGDNNYVCADGAHLKVTNKDTGDLVEEWVSSCSTDNGNHVVTANVADGTYILTETVPAPGYATAESIEFTVKDGEVTAGETTMYDKPLDIKVYKVSSNTSKLLAGAEFTLYDENDNVVTTFTTTDSVYTFPIDCKLEVGKKYTLVETKAPTGYKKAANYTFTVKDTADEQPIEINDDVVVESTGSNTPIGTNVLILIIGLTGLCLVANYQKKHKYDYLDD